MCTTDKDKEITTTSGNYDYYIRDKCSKQNINENGNVITQMDWNRDMFVCMLNSNKNVISKTFGHKCVCILYVSLVSTRM